MELYVYDTPDGRVADFRPYLDGLDHAFDDHRPLPAQDPRWEKIDNLYHPRTGRVVGRQLRWVGMAECRWKELTMFPVAWEAEFTPLEVE